MSDDIVDRLQSHMGKAEVPDLLRDCREAAAEITRLREDARAAGAVKVRELEWARFDSGGAWAKTDIGLAYFAEPDGSWRHRNGEPAKAGNNLSAAKAGAQANFEAIVLSALATYDAGAVKVPAGWQILPVEPTSEMMLAGDTNTMGYRMGLGTEFIANVWRSMRAAAPPPNGEAQCRLTRRLPSI